MRTPNSLARPPGTPDARLPPAAPKRSGFRYDRESRVDRLMARGFDQRIRSFRESGKALELREVPEVLDALLDLNSTELEEVLNLMGLDATELRRDDGSRLGRITPDYVVQLLGGNRHGAFHLLPTTEEQATEALARVAKQLEAAGKTSTASGEPERLKTLHDDLLSVRDRLRQVPRTRGWQEMGLTATLMLSAGKSNPLDDRTPGQRTPGVDFRSEPMKWRGRALGHGSSISAGLGLSRVDRHTGKREVVPYAQLSSDMVLGGVNYTLKKDERSLDWSFHPFFLTIGTDPVCGRNLYFNPPLGFSFTIGERFLGIGLPLNLIRKGAPLITTRHLDVDPVLLLGLRGDPIQEFTGPTIRWAFKAYDAFKRALGLPQKRKPNPVLEVGEIEKDRGGAPSDWLASGALP